MLRNLGIAVFGLSTILFVAAPSTPAQSAQIVKTHHLPSATRSGSLQPIGHLPADKILALDIVLPLRDQAGLDLYFTQTYDPTSPIYKHYLTPEEFAAKFGPSQADYDTVVAFLKNNGLPVTGGSFLGREVQVKAPVSAIEATFHIAMNTYQHPTEARTFYSPDREPTTNLPFPLWHISGLDNFSIPKPKLVSRDDYAKAHGIKPEDVVNHATTGSGPSASYLGSDMRAAYYGGTALTGAGQTLGLFEFLGTDLDDLNTYFTNIGQTNHVPITLLSVDGTSTACLDTTAGGKCDDGEQTLDMTQALGMAPGLANLVMYIGDDDTAIIAAMVSHSPVPSVIGCSWGWTPADPTSDDPYFEQMAVQGQNFFVASGDDSTWTKTGNAESWPADDPYIVGVGGTDLITSSAAGPWASETAWADSGGGSSPNKLAIPSYQTLAGVVTVGNAGSTLYRNGPDVSANANFTFYTCGDQKACQSNYYGGTSFAAPMWAGYIALVNQALAAKGEPNIGFLNPLIYPQNLVSATYATNFHDILSGKSGSYTATTGFDLVTGWGSPTPAFLTTLTTLPGGTPDFSLAAASSSVAAPGVPVTDAITVTSLSAFTGTVTYSCTSTGGLACSFSPTSSTLTSGGTGNTTVTIDPSAVTTAGTYSVTVFASTAGSTDVRFVNISVIVTLPDFTLSAASSTLAATGNSVTDVMTLTSKNGFAVSPALICTAAGGMTCALSPTSVALTSGSTGTSTLTVNTSAVTTSGTYAVLVTGTSGSKVHTATINVTVTITPGSPNFTLSNGGAITIASQGANGTTALNLTANAYFSGTTALGCSITSKPQGAIFLPTCIVTSSIAVTSGATGSGTLTINTTPQTLGALWLKPTSWLAGGLFFAFLLIPISRPRRSWPTLAILFTGALLLGNTLGCSSKNLSATNNPLQSPTGGTTLGGYVVTVTATSGSVTSSTAVTVTVN